MKNYFGIIGLVLVLSSLGSAIYVQFISGSGWMAFGLSAAGLVFGVLGIFKSPRVLAVSVTIAAVILSFWNLLVAGGGL